MGVFRAGWIKRISNVLAGYLNVRTRDISPASWRWILIVFWMAAMGYFFHILIRVVV
jgi:hypothetical protein